MYVTRERCSQKFLLKFEQRQRSTVLKRARTHTRADSCDEWTVHSCWLDCDVTSQAHVALTAQSLSTEWYALEELERQPKTWAYEFQVAH